MKTRFLLPWLAMVVLVAWPSVAAARSKSEVLKSRKARYPVVAKLTKAGKVGETYQGLVDAVKDAYRSEKVDFKGKAITIGQLIADENKDRTDYFRIVAQETDSTPEAVAKNYAQRRRAKLKSGEYWKTESGAWVRKK